jgi:hypothetical protein
VNCAAVKTINKIYDFSIYESGFDLTFNRNRCNKGKIGTSYVDAGLLFKFYGSVVFDRR